jgi:hypothetical protein
VREGERNRLAVLHGELADRLKVFAEKYGRGSQDQALGTGNRVNGTVCESVDPGHGRPVIKTHHKLSMKDHAPGPPAHNAHEIGAVCWRHEVDNRRTASLSLKLGFEDERAGTIPPSHAEWRTLWSNQPAAVVGRSKQSGKARGRVETGPAQTID